jgi:hypothetical protein
MILISHVHKFIYLRAFKVGGTSTFTALQPLADFVEYRHPHVTPSEAKERFPQEWEDYRTITNVRNPYDFEVSAAHHVYRLRRISEKLGYSPVVAREWLSTHFEEYMETKAQKITENRPSPYGDRKWGLNVREEDRDHLHSLHIKSAEVDTNSWFFEPYVEFDTYLRFERINEDFRALNFNVALPHKNGFKYRDDNSKEYRRFHTDRTKELTEKFHAYELNAHGYEF